MLANKVVALGAAQFCDIKTLAFLTGVCRATQINKSIIVHGFNQNRPIHEMKKHAHLLVKGVKFLDVCSICGCSGASEFVTGRTIAVRVCSGCYGRFCTVCDLCATVRLSIFTSNIAFEDDGKIYYLDICGHGLCSKNFIKEYKVTSTQPFPGYGFRKDSKAPNDCIGSWDCGRFVDKTLSRRGRDYIAPTNWFPSETLNENLERELEEIELDAALQAYVIELHH